MKNFLIALILIISASNCFAKDDKIVATVNGQNIYQSSVDALYGMLDPSNIDKMGGKDAIQSNLVKQLSAAEALKQAALNSDIKNDPQVKKLIEQETEQLIQQEFLKTNIEKRVSEDDVKATYEKAKKEFKPEMEYHMYNIIVKEEDQAKDIIKQLDKGADFQTLAKEKSISLNASKTGGDLGYVLQNNLIDVAGEEITSLKKDTYSKQPIPSAFGWNVFYLKDKRLQATPTLEEASDMIKQSLYKQEMIKFVQELSDKADIVIK
jgi:parvulin-like peptidyl-prolyl isomerase